MSIKDFEVTVKIRNGRLIGLMQQAGIATLTELANRSGVSQTHVTQLAGMKVSGRDVFGKWRRGVIKLSEFFGCMPEELIPEKVRNNPATRTSIRMMIDTIDAQTLISSLRTLALPPGARMEQEQTQGAVHSLLSTLTPKEERVLRMRYGFNGGPMTLIEVGREIGLSQERVRQIETEAFQKLKRPSRIHWLARQCGVEINQKSCGLEVDRKDLLRAVSGEDDG